MDIKRSTYYYRPKDNFLKKKLDADLADLIEKLPIETPLLRVQENNSSSKKRWNSGKP